MNRFFALCFVCSILFCVPAQAINDPFNAPSDPLSLSHDKLLHFAGSYAIAFTSTTLMTHHEVPRKKALIYSALLTFGLGLSKELFTDKFFSYSDLGMDLLGIAGSTGIVIGFDLFDGS